VRSKSRRRRARGDSRRYDAFVALGVVIRGETYHFEIVAGESARGLMALALDGIAIGNGILTVETKPRPSPARAPTTRTKAAKRPKRRWAMLALRERFTGD